MTTELKTHLNNGANAPVCGSKAKLSVNITVDPEEITCFKCRAAYRKSKAWWNAQCEKSKRESLTMVTPPITEFADRLKDGMKQIGALLFMPPAVVKSDDCEVCGNDIRVICFTGTGVCSENCRAVRDKEDIYALS